VESDEASHIAGAVERAVDATNTSCPDAEYVDQRENVPQPEADAVASEVRATQRRPDFGDRLPD
jgi:hypothetical protein